MIRADSDAAFGPSDEPGPARKASGAILQNSNILNKYPYEDSQFISYGRMNFGYGDHRMGSDRERPAGHQRCDKHGHQLLRACDTADFCRRSDHRLGGRHQDFSKIQQWRPRRRQDCRSLVWKLYFLDCQRNCVAVILFIDMEYEINRGIGRDVEFRGLTAQYLFIFAGGLLGAFFLLVILYIAGIPQGVCICTGITVATTVVYLTFRLNKKYGRWGLMKLVASKRHPRRIVHRKRIRRIFRCQKKI